MSSMFDNTDQDQDQDQGNGQDQGSGSQSNTDAGPDSNPQQGGVQGYGDTPYGGQDSNQGGTSAQDPSQQDPNAASYDQSQYGTNQDQGSSGGYDSEQQGGYDPDQSGGDQGQ